METCLFVLCLDDCISMKTVRSQRRDSIQMARMEPSYMASMLLHGGGSEFYTANRWFDKFLQVFQFSNKPFESHINLVFKFR